MLGRVLTDERADLIKDMFDQPAATRRPWRDPREMLEAIVWIWRTGSPWRDLPAEFGPWQTAYHYFRKWTRSGLLRKLFYRLRDMALEWGLVDVEARHVDGTVVRAARAAAGGGKKGAPRSLATTP